MFFGSAFINRVRFRRLYFYHLFVNITLLMAVIVMVLCVFLYFSFKNHSISMLNQSRKEMMEQIAHNAEQVHEHMKSYAVALFNTLETSNLMYEENLSIRDTLNNMRALDRSLNSNRYVYSAYVYNGRTDTYYIFGPNTLIRRHSFYDEEIARILKENRFPGITPFPRKIPNPLNEEEMVNVYTYIVPEYFRQGETLKNALVLNVRVDSFFDSLANEAFAGSAWHYSMLTDLNGSVLAHPDPGQFLNNLADQSFVSRILNSSSPSGTFMDKIGEETSLVTFVTSESLPWKLINITSYEYISRQIEQVRFLTMTIGLIMLSVCLIAAFFVSRHLYVPVHNLRDKFKKLVIAQEINDHAGNEFEELSRMFLSTHHQCQSLKDFKNNNLDHLKEKFFNDLIRGKVARSRLDGHMKGFSSNIDLHRPGVMILFKIDHYSSFCAKFNRSDRTLMKYAVINIAYELLSPVFPCEVADTGDDHVTVFMNAESGRDHAEMAQKLAKPLMRIQDSAMEYCSLSMSCVVSDPFRSFQDAPAVFEELQELAHYRMKYGHRILLFSKELISDPGTDEPLDPQLLRQLMEAVKEAKIEAIEQVFRQIMAGLRRCNYNRIMLNLSQLTWTLFTLLSEMEKNTTAAFGTDFSTFDLRLKSLETLDEIEQTFQSFFRQMVQEVAKNRNGKNRSIVDHAVKFIDRHYMDPALSTNGIADMYHLTPAYLNKLFRTHLSRSVSEYLTEVRLDKAKQLLGGTDLTIDQIIERIGWTNKKYFFTVFKKRYGATPMEYRLKQNLDHLQDEPKSQTFS